MITTRAWLAVLSAAGRSKPLIRLGQHADWHLARQMKNCPIEYGEHVLMPRSRVVVEPYEALPSGEEPSLEWRCGRELLREEPSQPPFCSIWHTEVAASRRQRQRSYETVAVSISEAAFDPGALNGNTTASIHEDLEVADWCLMWIIEGHVSPLRSHGLSEIIALGRSPQSQH
jgi:hypothetical protein